MDRRRKKLGIVLTAFVLAVSVAGCGNRVPAAGSSNDLAESGSGMQSSSTVQESSENSVTGAGSSGISDQNGRTSEEVESVIQDILDGSSLEEASSETEESSVPAESLETEENSETVGALETASSQTGEAASSEEAAGSSSAESTPAKDYKISKKYGSAKNIAGKTLVMSIFADEESSNWDWEDQEDLKRYSDMYYGVEKACNWLEEQCRAYGAQSDFVWDWIECADLYRKVSFTEKLIRSDGDGYDTQKNWILDNVNLSELLKKYDADNILFLFFFDSDPEGTPTPRTISVSCGEDCQIELCNIFVRYDQYVVRPNAMAHEMMHCFGAPDLYYANEQIPQKYVDHLAADRSEDIMYMLYDSDEISETFTELDAYYVGLTDSCAEVTEWGLGKSDFDE